MAGGKIVSQLRRGIRPHKLVTLGNGSNTTDVMVVLLPSDIMLDIETRVEEFCQDNPKKSNMKVRTRLYNRLLCYYCMMDPDDINIQIFDDMDDVGKILDEEDIKRVCMAYNELMANKAPKIEMMKQDEFDELKKYLEVTQLSDLSTVSLVHLTNFHRTIVSEK
jgi:hypothetical protein